MYSTFPFASLPLILLKKSFSIALLQRKKKLNNFQAARITSSLLSEEQLLQLLFCS